MRRRGLRMDLRKREVQAVIDQFHHGVYSLSLPVSVTDLTHDAQDRVVPARASVHG